MKLHVSNAAAAEVKDAVTYFESVREGLGELFAFMYEQRLQSIAAVPQSFPKLCNVPSNLDIRFTQLRRFKYVIFFETVDDDITVLAVAHGKRKPKYWFRRRKP